MCVCVPYNLGGTIVYASTPFNVCRYFDERHPPFTKLPMKTNSEQRMMEETTTTTSNVRNVELLRERRRRRRLPATNMRFRQRGLMLLRCTGFYPLSSTIYAPYSIPHTPDYIYARYRPLHFACGCTTDCSVCLQLFLMCAHTLDISY